MKALILCILLISLLRSSLVSAAEGESLRSQPDDSFWVSVSGGLAGLKGVGSAGDVNLKYIFLARCGPILDWHVQELHYYDPADVRNSIAGAGVSCALPAFWSKHNFARGAHLAVQLMAEYGQSDYLVYDDTVLGHHSDVAGGSRHAFGAASGVDLFFPIYFGFWATAGASFEALDWRYDVPATVGGHRFPGISNQNFSLRIGLSSY